MANVSEYQYYGFLAIDRPLTGQQQAELQELPTRAEITSTRFTNEYHWGHFKGGPRTMMERYFDAHLYFAIEIHDNPAFGTWAEFLRGELDRVIPQLPAASQNRCEQIFARATRLELRFFEATYTGSV